MTVIQATFGASRAFVRVRLKNSTECALVDIQDADRVLAAGPWSVSHDERRRLTFAYRRVAVPGSGWRVEHLHRFILSIPPEQVVGVRNHNGLDCRRSNIELGTRGALWRFRRQITARPRRQRSRWWDWRPSFEDAVIEWVDRRRAGLTIPAFAEPGTR